MLRFRKFLDAKNCMDKREGDKSRVSSKKNLSHSAEKCRRGTI